MRKTTPGSQEPGAAFSHTLSDSFDRYDLTSPPVLFVTLVTSLL